MEISLQDYCDLQRKVSELQDQVDSLTKAGRTLTLADLVAELPIYGVAFDGSSPHYRTGVSSPQWNAFILLAKKLHTSTPQFTQRRYTCNGSSYFDKSREIEPKRIADLTPDQVDLSVAMLNELIPIYNKYYEACHGMAQVNFRRNGPEFIAMPITKQRKV